MKPLSISIVILAVILSISCRYESRKQVQKDKGPKITFVEDNTDKRIDVMIDGKLFNFLSLA